MGFCRRCGDIVVGPRCKCGGTAVGEHSARTDDLPDADGLHEAPVVKWDQGEKQSQDRWSRTYVTGETKEKSPTRPADRSAEAAPHTASIPQASTAASTRRFPRPTSTSSGSVTLGSRVSAHIASTTTSRPPSPLKYTTSLHDDSEPSTSANAAAGILPNPNGSELAKVYGSILQPKETLSSYHCALCSTSFPPDATIYPDPANSSSEGGANPRFLCRSCFTENGGSKGPCASCGRPVLILKTEGGFVENGGRVWHKKCFRCDGCSRDIGDKPMVDLLGRPSCAECFETCLTRSTKESPHRPGDLERSNLGGTRRTDREREGSPALEELEQRLGIVRSREGTPAKDDERTGRSNIGTKHPNSTPTTNRSPATRYTPRAADVSPIAERLAARARTDSFTPLTISPITHVTGDGTSTIRPLRRFQSPESDSTDDDADSPLASRHNFRYRSPEPATSVSDGSPVPRRTYNRFKSPEPDLHGTSPASRIGGSPRYGSPVGSKQPTEEAIEEMKQRFLRQASPAPASSSVSEAENTTPRRRSASRPRTSKLPEDNPLTSRAFAQGQAGQSKIPRSSALPSTKNDSPGPAFRTSVRHDAPTEPDYTLRRDRTGDAEVESLLGGQAPMPLEDLIDLSTDGLDNGELPRSESTGPMTEIPLQSHGLSTRLGREGLNIRTSISASSFNANFQRSVPSTPDLAGDLSDTTSNSQSSAPSTPPSISPPSRRTSNDIFHTGGVLSHTTGGSEGVHRKMELSSVAPTPKSKTHTRTLGMSSPTPLSPNARCTKCKLPLFTTKHGGKFVTVPEEPSSSGVPPKTYHTLCFRCKVCDGLFEEREGGHAVFVRGQEGACHVEVSRPFTRRGQ